MPVKLPWRDCRSQIQGIDPIRPIGRVAKLVGLVIEVEGMAAPVGSLCRIEIGRQAAPVLCEVVGFRDHTLFIMPYRDASGIAPNQRVTLLNDQVTVPVGPQLLGRVLNGIGQPIDGGPPLGRLPRRRVSSPPPPALARRRATEVLETGVCVLDAMLTVARGQRMGIFAGSGVGKSVLLGMLARHARVDVNVLALIGERGREVKEFLERDLGPQGLARSVVVVVTSDESAVLRAKGAETAMAIAESFREADQEVLFLMDSATRYAMALREIGLAAGEPPTTKGYTPSVFTALPKLCERAGWSAINAMTAFFTVLIEGDDIHDPIGDAMRALLDGHIMLSRDLARANHYPAVDVLGSVSRLRQEILAPDQLAAGVQVLKWLKALDDNRDLINIGAYVAGSDPVVDEALARERDIAEFLQQEIPVAAPLADSLARLKQLTKAGAA
jgi:flagellum-specific ATP synthase